VISVSLSDNQVAAEVFVNSGGDSGSSSFDSNSGSGGSSDLLQQTQSNALLQQIPSNITDFPSPSDASTIQLTFLKPSKDLVDAYHIRGEIKNMGNDSLSFVKVKSHFYDNNMNIVAIESGYTDPEELGPGQTGDFDIILMKDDYGSTPPTFFKLSYEWR
jgi:hypothetical protein